MRRGGLRPSGHKGTLTLGTAVELRDELSDSPFARVAEGEFLPTATGYVGDRIEGQLPTVAADRVEWGVYGAAVRRWELVSGRPAPAPTDEKGRLAPAFVEWMLGYPPGWFDIDGVSRTRKLRALGNSVQVQAAEAVGGWLAFLVEAGLLA